MFVQSDPTETMSSRTRYIAKDCRSGKELISELQSSLLVLPEDWDALPRRRSG